MAISQSQLSTWGIDIGVFSGFMIDLNQIAGIDVTGVRKPEFSGKTIINIDTSNLYAWYLFVIVSELSAMISLFVVIQLRAIIMSLQNGVSFTQLSELVGVTMANLSILKRGKAKAIRFSTLIAICKALDCQPGDLLKLKQLQGE